MPIVGELIEARKINKHTNNSYRWSKCPSCGLERWSRKNTSPLMLCHTCFASQNIQKLISNYKYNHLPHKSAKELGFKARCNMYLDYCPKCNKEIWRQPHYIGANCKLCKDKEKQRLQIYGENNINWKGGIIKARQYKAILLRNDDPYYEMVNKHGYVLEHRLILAKHLGRCLKRYEIVHHKNGDKLDNRIENLELLPSANEHSAYTVLENKIKVLEKKVTLLEAENILLKAQIDDYILKG